MPQPLTTSDTPRTVEVNHTRFYVFTSAEQVVDYTRHRRGLLIAVNAGKLRGTDNPARPIINANIGYADGMGAVWAARSKGATEGVKIPGCELWLKIIGGQYRMNGGGRRFYFIGAKTEVVEAVVERLRRDFPGITIAGYRNGYFGPQDEPRVIEEMAQARPDNVFVAMGSPRQELFMQAAMARHPALYMGLGGSFDVYSGRAQRAPEWVLRYNLEAPYRFLHNPSARYRRFAADLWFLVGLKLGHY